MADEDRIVAVGSLTARDLALLGPRFARLFPLPPGGDFAELLKTIDEADYRRRDKLVAIEG